MKIPLFGLPIMLGIPWLVGKVGLHLPPDIQPIAGILMIVVFFKAFAAGVTGDDLDDTYESMGSGGHDLFGVQKPGWEPDGDEF